eukprot:gene3246-3760_t
MVPPARLGMRLADYDPATNEEGDWLEYGWKTALPPLIPLIIAAMCCLSCLPFCIGRYCCKCCGSSKQTKGFCCAGKQPTNYLAMNVLAHRILPILLLVPFLVGCRPHHTTRPALVLAWTAFPRRAAPTRMVLSVAVGPDAALDAISEALDGAAAIPEDLNTRSAVVIATVEVALAGTSLAGQENFDIAQVTDALDKVSEEISEWRAKVEDCEDPYEIPGAICTHPVLALQPIGIDACLETVETGMKALNGGHPGADGGGIDHLCLDVMPQVVPSAAYHLIAPPAASCVTPTPGHPVPCPLRSYLPMCLTWCTYLMLVPTAAAASLYFVAYAFADDGCYELAEFQQARQSYVNVHADEFTCRSAEDRRTKLE